MNHYQDISDGIGVYVNDRRREADEARLSQSPIRVLNTFAQFDDRISSSSLLTSLILKGDSQVDVCSSPLDYEEGYVEFLHANDSRTSVRWTENGTHFDVMLVS